MKIKTFDILFAILFALLTLNACSVNWDSPETQSVDQMFSDDGLGPAYTPGITPVSPQTPSAVDIEPVGIDNLSIQPNTTQQNESKWFKVGSTRFDQGRYNESLQAYNKVIDINPQNAAAWNNRGIDLGLLGKYDNALRSFLKATTINSSFAEAWFNVGIAYDFFGEYNNAIDAYTRATEINPNYVQAQRNKNEDIDFVRNHEMNPYP
jgi:tetratricopeptide (TPR) repeat protein